VGEAPRLLHDDRQGLPPLVLAGGAAQLQRLAEEQDLGQRSAQLVRHAGGEVVPEPHQLVLAAELPRGDRSEPRGEHEQAEQQRQPRAGARHDQLARDVGRQRGAYGDGTGIRCGVACVGAPWRARPEQGAAGGIEDREAHEPRVGQSAGHLRRQQRMPRHDGREERREGGPAGRHAVHCERRLVRGVAVVADGLDRVDRHGARGGSVQSPYDARATRTELLVAGGCHNRISQPGAQCG
jgi:hypothetical protein